MLSLLLLIIYCNAKFCSLELTNDVLQHLACTLRIVDEIKSDALSSESLLAQSYRLPCGTGYGMQKDCVSNEHIALYNNYLCLKSNDYFEKVYRSLMKIVSKKSIIETEPKIEYVTEIIKLLEKSHRVKKAFQKFQCPK